MLVAICIIFLTILTLIGICKLNVKIKALFIVMLITFINIGIVAIDYSSQTNCNEIWSGKIISIEHKEEWDEWIPEEGHTDDKGVYHVDEEAHWEHHNAKNYITTSDNGNISVNQSLDGKHFSDSFVNSNKELAKYYPIGMPTASIHVYENKVQASYSIYKNREINLKDYEGKLPNYPNKNNNRYSIDRFIGNIHNKDKVLNEIDNLNSNLNNFNNPNNKNKQKSYKQVNVIFVNMGDVPEDYGFALQDYWKNGNKNDFIICFGSKNNKIIWCNVFSWSEVEILKLEVRDYILDQANLNDFIPTIKDTGKIIEDKFIRKQFKDFSYLNIETTNFSKGLIIFLTIVGSICILSYKEHY